MELIKSARQYADRFGHLVPTLSLSHLSMDQVQEQINAALKSGKPVPGWDKMATEDVVQEPNSTSVAARSTDASEAAPASTVLPFRQPKATEAQLKAAETRYKAEGLGPAEIAFAQAHNRGEI